MYVCTAQLVQAKVVDVLVWHCEICSMTLFAHPQLNPMQAEHTDQQPTHSHTLTRTHTLAHRLGFWQAAETQWLQRNFLDSSSDLNWVYWENCFYISFSLYAKDNAQGFGF